MASTYSTNLALELIATGEQSGTWGNTTNTNLGVLLEQAISGYVTQAITDGADTTITIPNGATGVARNMSIEMTGALTGARNLIVPANKKLYFIYNNTTGSQTVTVKVSGQTGVAVAPGIKALLVCNGTDVVNAVVLPISQGGTGATTASAARTALDVPSNTEAILDTIVDAKGDLIVGTAADTVARKAAGTNGSLLLTDSTTGDGLAWLVPTSTVAAHATTMNPWVAQVIVTSGSAVTFTDIADAPYAGAVVWVKMNAAHIWTDGATFNVQGNASYTCAVDDWIRISAPSSVSAFDITIHKADGTPVVLPTVNLASGVTGTLAVDKGGTGQTTYTNGQLLIGNTTGNTLAKATLTQGTGISITNGGGSITIASTVTGGVSTDVGSLGVGMFAIGAPINSTVTAGSTTGSFSPFAGTQGANVLASETPVSGTWRNVGSISSSANTDGSSFTLGIFQRIS